MPPTRMLGAAVLFVALTPAAARADSWIIPFVGVNFGGDVGTEVSDALDAKRVNWGVSFGHMGGGIFGVEGDIGYSPDFFGKTDLGGTSVLTLTGNLLLGIPFGGQTGFGIRPYGLVGVGLVRTSVDAFGDLLELDNTEAAWDFGAGVMVFFGTHVGLRGDVRYFRTFSDIDFLDLVDEPGSVDFARASAGLTLRF
jgi:hypothetical protein